MSIQKIVQKQKQKQPRGAGVVSVCPGCVCVCVWFGMILESFRSFSSFGDRQGVEVWYRTVSFQQVAGRIRGGTGKVSKVGGICTLTEEWVHKKKRGSHRPCLPSVSVVILGTRSEHKAGTGKRPEVL